MSLRSHPHRPLAVAGVLALAGAGVLTAPAAHAAVSVDAPVIISEVYGGGGNSGSTFTHDFIELYNPTSAPVDLTGWSLQYASATGNFNTSHELTGTIAPGGYFLVQQAQGSRGTTPLPTPDAVGTLALSGSTGKVALVSSTTRLVGSTGNAAGADSVVDFVGWGSGASDFAGTGPAPGTSNATSVSRDAGNTHTADNAADFTAGAPTPQASTAAGEEPGGEEPGGEEPGGEEPGGEEPPALVTIPEIQGTGAESPLAGQTVRTRGVVTASYPTGGFNGFVIQTPGTGDDLDLAAHAASEAVFVYTPSFAPAEIGAHVEVTGVVSEFFGLTEVTAAAASDVTVLAETADAPVPATVAWPTDDAQREALESMLVAPQGPFTVSNTYATNQYGEVGLAAGTTPLWQPTDRGRPGSPVAAETAADNAARGVILDDGATTNFLNAANASLTPPYVSMTEPVVVGGAVTFDEPVIVDWRNGAWKFNPIRPLVGDGTGTDHVTFSNPRAAAPEPVGGDVSVAAFNVLNYFTTLGVEGAACQAYTDRDGNGVTVRTGCAQRGAWGPADLQRQQDKLVEAITTLDADVVGLMEIENSAALGKETDAATATLVDALNAAAGADRWEYVTSPMTLPDLTEQDVITNAIIYQRDAVTPVGASVALGDQSAPDAAFGNAREPIGQVFEPAAGGEAFLLVVNHFKSKGSPGPWPGDADTGDGQGSSNESRMRQATALRDWVETVRGDVEAVLLAGDFNSYTFEDPMQVFYDAGYSNATLALGIDTASYSFGGQSGSLDHILLNAAALERATGGDIWNINSGEAVALEYSRHRQHGTTFYAPDAFRSSDHDPVLVGLSAGDTGQGTGEPGDGGSGSGGTGEPGTDQPGTGGSDSGGSGSGGSGSGGSDSGAGGSDAGDLATTGAELPLGIALTGVLLLLVGGIVVAIRRVRGADAV